MDGNKQGVAAPVSIQFWDSCASYISFCINASLLLYKHGTPVVDVFESASERRRADGIGARA
jgi:hypothetical protein